MRRVPLIIGTLGAVSGGIAAVVAIVRGCGVGCDGINESVHAAAIIATFVMAVVGLSVAILSVAKPKLAAGLMTVPVVLGIILWTLDANWAIAPTILFLVAGILAFLTGKASPAHPTGT